MNRAAVTLCLALFLALPAAAADFDERFAEAREMTWSSATREAGVEILRRLVEEKPGAFGPRYELAQVLTWDKATRDEGIERLRALEQEYPENGDVVEALGQTLTWNPATRDEGTERLRRLAEAQPERTSARLALAEVLSWQRETRPEAEALYREVLASNPDSAKARVGLARLRSWTGGYDEARTLYEEALAADPSDVDARVGLAQISAWSGRPRRALYVLDGLDREGLADKEAMKVRGEALEGIGYRGRAFDLYSALLADAPGDPWLTERTERLEDGLRPRLRVGLFSSTESGDPATSKLGWVRAPVTWSWSPAPELELETFVGAQLASFRNRPRSSTRVSVGGGAELPVGRHLELSGEVWLHDFEDADGEVAFDARAEYTPVDRVALSLGVRREPLLSSLLSATGEVVGGVLYGPAMYREARLGVDVRLSRRWDATFSAGTGTVGGTNLSDNDRVHVYADVGRRFDVRGARLTAKVLVHQHEHDFDLGGFPPSDLGGDGLTSRGVGGYFSPYRFRNQMLQLDAEWRHSDRLDFFVSGGLGLQQVEDVFDTDFSDTDVSSRALFVVSWRATERLIVRGIAERMDVADAFDRTRLGGELVILF